MSWLFIWGGQSVGASASAADLPVNIQDWFPLGLTSLISLLPNYSQESSPRPQFKGIHFLALRRLCDPNLSYVHDYWKKQSIDNMGLCHQIMSLLFNTSSRFVIAFLPRSKHLLIWWLQSPSRVISEPKLICHCFYFSLFYLPWSDGTRCNDLSFLNVELRPAFSLSSFTLIKRLCQVVWYSHLFNNFCSLLWSTSRRVLHSQWSRDRCFSGIPLQFLWSNTCWQFDLWFPCLFETQLVHLEVLSSEN